MDRLIITIFLLNVVMELLKTSSHYTLTLINHAFSLLLALKL